MTKPQEVFFEVPCLTEQSRMLSGFALQKKWFKSADKRFIGQFLQKFVDYNLSNFEFLGIRPIIIGSDQNTALRFRTSAFIGAIPLRAPDTGRQIGDFVVTPRYVGQDKFEDYVEVLHLLESGISPEFRDSLPLASGNNFRPPFYLEAVKFVYLLEKLVAKPWRKFDNIEKQIDQPAGQVNWTEYINKEYKVEHRLIFPSRLNVLSEFHSEYAEVRYVFDLSKKELFSSSTPIRLKYAIKDKLNFLERRLYNHKPKPTKQIPIRFSDSADVKACKEQANQILNFNFIYSTAWRVDFSDVFEKFIQHIFNEVAKEAGGRLFSNFKFYSKTPKYYSWELKHIEPDAIYQKGDIIVFIDAKYKSNLYNKYDSSEMLKSDHRHDLHQILAYASFGKFSTKFNFLCYPSDRVEMKSTQFKNGINEVVNTIQILGVPLKQGSIKDVKQLLITELDEIGRATY